MELSDSQKEAYRLVLEGKNVFITGSAGTGKSYLLSKIRQDMSVPFAVTSTTGISAVNVSGVTINSYFGIGIPEGRRVSEIVQTSIERVGWRLRKVKTIFIDEISMCSGRMLNLIDKILKAARGNEAPFGGVQIVFIGDFHQLPPIGDNEEYCFKSRSWREANIKISLLETNYRQRDKRFYNILQECRRGFLSKESIDILSSRVKPLISEDVLRIKGRNSEVNDWNFFHLEKIKSKTHSYESVDEGNKSLLINLLAPDILQIKEGARVMLLANLSLESELYNGSMGVVEKCGKSTVTVKFDNGVEKELYPHLWKIERDKKVLASRSQIPLRLAWGITIHKCQGQTYDRASVSMKNIWETGQAYVALSRVRTLEGLFLEDLDPNKFEVDKEVLSFYEQVR